VHWAITALLAHYELFQRLPSAWLLDCEQTIADFSDNNLTRIRPSISYAGSDLVG